MATPSPISAIRNSTIWLTPVTSVSPPTTRNVASTEMPPMSSGSSARKLANTSARMTSAPTEPIIASVITPVPLDGDHRQVRGLRAAVAVLADDLVVDLERLPRHGEVVRHPVGSAADGHHADSRHDNPEQGHERLVAEDEAGERWHRDLQVRNSWVPAAAPPAAAQECRRGPPVVVPRRMALGGTAAGLAASGVLPGE